MAATYWYLVLVNSAVGWRQLRPPLMGRRSRDTPLESGRTVKISEKVSGLVVEVWRGHPNPAEGECAGVAYITVDDVEFHQLSAEGWQNQSIPVAV